MRILEVHELKNIFGGNYQPVQGIENDFAVCSKDCPGGTKVTCSGRNCSTTDTGCYSQNDEGGIDWQRC